MTTPILGTAQTSADVASRWALEHGAPVGPALDLAPIYWRLCPLVGVRPEVAWAQACHETGFFRYGRAVTPEHHNYCGLKVRHPGADDAADSHARFPTPEVGIVAHRDHLARYAGVTWLSETPDPRFTLVTPGSAPNVEDLGRRWAPSPDYGTTVASKVRALILSPFV